MSYLADGPEGEELTDRITQESIAFMRQNRTNDFFLYIPHFAVHFPFQGKGDSVNKYRKLPKRDGQGRNAHYAAMVENLDQNMGKHSPRYSAACYLAGHKSIIKKYSRYLNRQLAICWQHPNHYD